MSEKPVIEQSAQTNDSVLTANSQHTESESVPRVEQVERAYADFKSEFTTTNYGYSLNVDVYKKLDKSKALYSFRINLTEAEPHVEVHEYRPDEANPVKFGQVVDIRMGIAFRNTLGWQPHTSWDFNWDHRTYEREFDELQSALLEKYKGLNKEQIEQMIERLALEHPLGQKSLAFQKAVQVLDRYLPLERKRLSTPFDSPEYSYTLVKQRQHLYTQLHTLYAQAGLNPEEAAREINNAIFEGYSVGGYKISEDNMGRRCLVLEGHSTGYYQDGETIVTYNEGIKMETNLKIILELAKEMGYEVGSYDMGGVHENFMWSGIVIPNFNELSPEQVLAEVEKIKKILNLSPSLERL